MQNVEAEVRSKISGVSKDSKFVPLLAHHFSACVATQEQSWEVAYEEQIKTLETFKSIFREQGTGWMLPALFVVIADLRVISKAVHIPLFTLDLLTLFRLMTISEDQGKNLVIS